MVPNRRRLDDIAKIATSAVGILQGAGREAEGLMRIRMERLLDRMDLVTRDEFDAVRAMAVAAREENAALKERIAALEAAAKPAPKSAPRSTARAKSAPKTKARRKTTG